MDITSFIPSQGATILERFQQLEPLKAASLRLEEKVSNPVGIIYDAFLLIDVYADDRQAEVSFRILYERDVERISLDVVDIPGRASLANYLQLLNIFEGLQNYLNQEFSRVKNA